MKLPIRRYVNTSQINAAAKIASDLNYDNVKRTCIDKYGDPVQLYANEVKGK